MDLPFEVPAEVSKQADKYDNGFLRTLLPHLKEGEPFKCKRDIFKSLLFRILPSGMARRLDGVSNVCLDFAASHSQALLYYPWRGGWNIRNYARCNMGFNPQYGRFGYRVYHVTHWDGTSQNGDYSELDIHPERDLHVVPYLIGDKLKAILIAERHENNPKKFDVDLLVGDAHQPEWMIHMPRFDSLSN